MWNTVILPILTSLSATGLGILAVWLYNRKRSSDKIANEIAGITNKIEAVEEKMDNGFNQRVNDPLNKIASILDGIRSKLR